jgi:tetratricopeptide (TPR) repeat protein
VWLSTNPDDWLVIMDNADDPSFRLLPYIAQSSRGNIIITTRNANHAMLAPNDSHHLEELSMDDAIDLILTASGYDNTDENRALARAIVEELGHLPLALAQAAGYIFVFKCLSTYLWLYRRSTETLLSIRPPELPYDHPSSVSATVQMSLDRLPTHALNILQLFAHLNSASILHAIIQRAAERKFRSVIWTEEHDLNMQTLGQADVLVDIFCAGGKWSEVDFNALITCCIQYSLLRVTTQDGSKFYSMHILVQSYLRAKGDTIQGHRPSQLTVRLLGSSTTLRDDYEDLTFNRLLLPHLRQILMEDVLEAGDHAGFSHVMERTGDNRLAVAHLERCVEMFGQSLGDEHTNTLWAMGNLANSYEAIGSFQKSSEFKEKVLDVQRRTLGAEHLITLLTAGNLAASYYRLGRYEESAKLFGGVLEARRRILGPDDALTMRTMSNLASCCIRLRHYQEALKLQEQVLEMQTRSIGPENSDTLLTMSNLADTYSIVGRLQDALDLNQQALEMRKKVVGTEHTDLLYSIRFQLTILRDLGRTEQFQDLLRVALPLHEKVLGVDHPDTVQLRRALERSFLYDKTRNISSFRR